MGILEVLTVVFVVLKLIGVIAWSWWAVFSPLLIAVGIYALFLIVWVITALILNRSITKSFKDDDFFK